MTAIAIEDAPPRRTAAMTKAAIVIVVGVVATTLGQPDVLGRLPLRLAQCAVILAEGRRYDAVLTWSDQASILVAALTAARVEVKKGGLVAIRVGSGRAELALLLRPREIELVAAL